MSFAISAAPRASHHIWTNLPSPGGWFDEATGDTFDPSDCEDRYRSLPHNPRRQPNDPKAESRIFDHIFGQLLFDVRYAAPSGFCRLYQAGFLQAAACAVDDISCLQVAAGPGVPDAR